VHRHPWSQGHLKGNRSLQRFDRCLVCILIVQAQYWSWYFYNFMHWIAHMQCTEPMSAITRNAITLQSTAQRTKGW
jgi:hypothetical protein